MLTLKIRTSTAHVEGHMGREIALFHRPNGPTDEQWRDMAADWGAKVIGAVLAAMLTAKGDARG